jgi:hypothetical protein
MHFKTLIYPILGISLLTSCGEPEKVKTEKGFDVEETAPDEPGENLTDAFFSSGNEEMETMPRGVLLTHDSVHRLTPIFRVNYNKKTKETYTGSCSYHSNWDYDYEYDSDARNVWNGNLMPGLSAVYGFNFVNVSHYNNATKTQNEFFENPVLIKTLYFPAFSNDTLNNKPIKRNYYIVTVYDEDSNKDGFLNLKDLRRMYLFNMDGNFQKELIPKNYSVMSSEYDSANDLMYVFAKLDENNNGQSELEESMHVFWIDLKNPLNNGLQYISK